MFTLACRASSLASGVSGFAVNTDLRFLPSLYWLAAQFRFTRHTSALEDEGKLAIFHEKLLLTAGV